jgi:hypothetical protein
MLKHEGVGYADPALHHPLRKSARSAQRQGGCDGRLQHQWPYLFEEDGTPYLGVSPRAYGFDFYVTSSAPQSCRLQRIPSP